ncbi:MAG TPA: transcription termination factor NusA [Pantanalinema sp.]
MKIDKELFKEMQRERGVSTEVLQEALEAGMLSAYKKTAHPHPNTIARLDLETGEFHVLDLREVVEEIEDPDSQMLLSEAKELLDEAEVGQVLEIDVTPDPSELGRLAAQMMKQVLNQRLREAERKQVLDQFKGKEGETIIGTVQRFEGRNIIVNFGKVEGIVPGSEQVPGESYRPGDRIKIFLCEVRETTRGMQLLVSRGHAGLVRELFELEIPEIMDGTVTIEAIAREAGFRTKLAVRSKDQSVDPVGACVGARGGRIQGIVNELRNEKIDIIRWSEDPTTFIANALSPAKVVSVSVNSLERTAKVVVPDAMLSLAIGREGQNVRLAARLTGYKIDIKSESQQRELNAAALESAMGEIENYPVDEEFVEEAATEVSETQSVETAAEEAVAAEEAIATEEAVAEASEETPAVAEEGEGV